MSVLWEGRLAGGLDPFFESFNRSIDLDSGLGCSDIEGSIAWARALGGAGVLRPGEVKKLVAALRKMHREIASDGVGDREVEDIHTYVETTLEKRIGTLARKLHTGRSRNDQVATDLKLSMKGVIANLMEHVVDLMRALVGLAERYPDLPLPGYTHLQRAQPITAGHHALAYVEMLHRDVDRLVDALGRMDTCPLGSAALAGTAFAVDRRALAKELDFGGGPTRNSLDAVSDRDHVCEVLFCCSMIMLHLSRLSEDYIFFASQEAGFLSFSDAVATGSSIMPQKKNPDAMELIRGKTGHVIGNLQAMLITMKGLPLAYNKDMQEDKQALWSPVQSTADCLRVAALVVRSASFCEERCRAASEVGFLNATDLADLLVRNGMPFRDAHHMVGKAVRHALELGVELQDLPDKDRRQLFGDLNLQKELSVSKVLARRKTIGGTAPQRVRSEVKAWKKRLATS